MISYLTIGATLFAGLLSHPHITPVHKSVMASVSHVQYQKLPKASASTLVHIHLTRAPRVKVVRIGRLK